MRVNKRWTFSSLRVLGLVVLGCAFLVGCEPSDQEQETEGGESGGGTETVAPEESEALPAGPTGTATLEGHIVYSGDVPTLKPIKMDADPQCAAKHDAPVLPQLLVLGDGGALANVLVRVVSGLPEGRYPPPAEPVVMDQHGCLYQPHVMALVAGQDLKVLNSDELLHNVHSLSEVNPSFNRAMPGTVREATFELDKPEAPFRVKCDVHPWMGAFVEVLEHPFFAISDESGSFSISGLPAGTYEIEAWHERLGSQKASVTVEDGGTAVSDFTFSRP